MFQLAAGLALAKHHDCELRLDIASFESNPVHQGFELQKVFGLDIAQATEDEYRRVLGWRGEEQVRKLLMHPWLAWARSTGYVAEPHFHYWDKFQSSPENSYLDGYWQTEKYFLAIAPLIRDAFSFVPPLTIRNQEFADQLASCNAISVHVRRGDYVTNSAANQIHGCCSLEYYENAIKTMLNIVNADHFVVFSDDPHWVKANLDMPSHTIFIDYNTGVESYNDMRLMSLCRHHIIANSSFSWWGAWMGGNPDKVVVAPKRWFQSALPDPSDLYCKEWVLL